MYAYGERSAVSLRLRALMFSVQDSPHLRGKVDTVTQKRCLGTDELTVDGS